MLNQIFKYSGCLLAVTFLLLAACQKDDELTTLDESQVENFTDESISDMQDEASCGKHGCFEFVFPITIQFPDSTTAEADSYESLYEIISLWKEENPDSDERPQLVYPIDIIAANGEMYTLESKEDMRRLRIRCHRAFRGHGPRGHRGKGYSCFKLVFPVTIVFPNEETADAGSRIELKVLLKAWHRTHPLADERPQLQFPLDVELDNGVIETVASKEGLETLKEECGG